MNLISVIVFLSILGLVWYLVDTYIPMPPGVKVVLRVLCVLILVVWLLQFAGFVGPLPLRLK